MKLCGFETGNRNPFFLIAGPCVIESREMVMEIASFIDRKSTRLNSSHTTVSRMPSSA